MTASRRTLEHVGEWKIELRATSVSELLVEMALVVAEAIGPRAPSDAGSETRSWGSACHGAGRAMSRHDAKAQVTGATVLHELEAQGIVVRCPSNKGLAEEAPLAYKDMDRVAQIVEAAGLARRVSRLRPVGVIKG